MHVNTITAELTRLLERLEKQLDGPGRLEDDMEEVSVKRSALQDFLWWIQRQEGSMEDLMKDAAILQDYGQISKIILEGINRHALIHQPVGDFLTAVLSNNLREAFARADEGNRKVMFQIVSYCHNQIPGVCWGTPEKVRAWIEMPVENWKRGLMAPETDREVERQNSLGIWGFTKFTIEQRLRELEEKEGGE